MTSHVRLRWCLLVGAVCWVMSSVGCGDGPGGRGEGEPPGVYSYMKSRAKLRALVQCRSRHETCPGKPSAENREATPESCLREKLEEWDELGGESGERYGLDGSVLEAVDAGAIDYDAEAAGECLRVFRSYVNQLSCVQAKRLESLVVRGVIEYDSIPACSEVFTPQTDKGDACEIDRECRDNMVCRRESEDAGDCGRCRAPEGPGTSTTSGFTYARKGESCASPNHSPTCDPTEPLLCEPTEAGGWSCQPETSKEEGDGCHAFGICEEGLTCMSGTCTSFETAAGGESCESNDVFCENPLLCRGSESGGKVCSSIGRNGDACESHAECAGVLWCSPEIRQSDEVGHCREPISEGEECDQRGHCAEGLFCPHDFQPGGGRCQSLRDEGEPCRSGADCVSGLRCQWDSSEGERTCQGSGDEESEETSIEACR